MNEDDLCKCPKCGRHFRRGKPGELKAVRWLPKGWQELELHSVDCLYCPQLIEFGRYKNG